MSSGTHVNRPMQVHPPIPSSTSDAMGIGGALAGLGGGLAMAVIAAIISLSVGTDIWLEAKQIAAPFYGQAAVSQPGFVAGPVILGTLLHLIISTILGAVFAIVVRRVFKLPTDMGAPVLIGIIYGMLIWLVAYFIVLPITDPLLLNTYAPAFIVQHIVYGAVTGILYAMLRPAPYHPLGSENGARG